MLHVHYLATSLPWPPQVYSLPPSQNDPFQWKSQRVTPLLKSGLPISLEVQIKVLILTKNHCTNWPPVAFLISSYHSPLLSSCSNHGPRGWCHLKPSALAGLASMLSPLPAVTWIVPTLPADLHSNVTPSVRLPLNSDANTG